MHGHIQSSDSIATIVSMQSRKVQEGTHGIYALDLHGRKAFKQDGSAMRLFEREVETTVSASESDESLVDFGA